MNSKPLLSIIVPIYNVEPYFSTCLDSLVAQTYENLEIILVEDGSPDGCGAICDAYAMRDSRIRVIHKQNGGVSSARNVGLAAATGELIAFVDSDDFIDTDMYERMYAHMAADERLDVVYCALTRFPAQGNKVSKAFYPTGTVISGREMMRRMLLDEISSHMVLGLFKRFCWDGIVFPEGRTYEDVAVAFQAFRKVRNVGFLTEPFYHYRFNDTGISRTVNPKKSYDIFQAFLNHYRGAQDYCPEVEGQCCAMAAHYAASVYFHYSADGLKELQVPAIEARAFLDSHKKIVKDNWNVLPGFRKLAIQVYYISPMLFRIGARVLRITGLQKKMGFQLK